MGKVGGGIFTASRSRKPEWDLHDEESECERPSNAARFSDESSDHTAVCLIIGVSPNRVP
jgi:hypothetical protein